MEKKRVPLLNVKLFNPENSRELEDAFHVRREVFIKEEKVPEKEELDEADLRSFHAILYESASPVATGRLFKDGDAWLIGRRVSVLKEFRGKNAGRRVVEKLMEKAFELGAEEVHAQTHAMRFYEKLGFTAYGKTFFEAGI